jgi:hypothetical protein
MILTTLYLVSAKNTISWRARKGDLQHRFHELNSQQGIYTAAEVFFIASGGEGSFDVPSPKRCSAGASLAVALTTPWMENAPATQATMTVPPRMAVLQQETNLLVERCHARHRGQQVQAHA